jgi:GxxExxY protein
MADLIYSSESYKMIGACFEVHKSPGHGFLENVYAEALMLEFEERSIPYERKKNQRLNITA